MPIVLGDIGLEKQKKEIRDIITGAKKAKPLDFSRKQGYFSDDDRRKLRGRVAKIEERINGLLKELADIKAKLN